MSQTLTIHGQIVKLPNPVRRYAVVNVRAAAIKTGDGVYVPFAHLVSQSDSLTRARRAAEAADRTHSDAQGVATLILDTSTGLPAGDPPLPTQTLILTTDQRQTLWSILQTEHEAAQDNLTDAELNSPDRVKDERGYLERVDVLRKLLIPDECTHSMDLKDDLFED